MKKVYILTVLLVCLLVVCKNDRILYEGGTYLLFGLNQTSYVLKEDDSIIEIPIVLTRSLSEPLVVTISAVTDSTTTAVEGYDFEIVDKTVTIPAGQLTTNVKVRALYENLIPEPVTLKLQYSGVPENLVWDLYGNTQTLSLSAYFDVDIDWMLGTWTATDYAQDDDSQDGDSYTVTISQASGDTLNITNIWGLGGTITAVADADNNQIIIPGDQVLGTYGPYGNVYMDWCVSGTGYSRTRDITAICEFTGITIQTWGAFVHDYQVGGYFGPIYTVLTR
ncbi:MAG: hypothetical protein LIO65_09570 [Odoribacter sp.]|nr:hypothetical protein [Odoribacter sp.]